MDDLLTDLMSRVRGRGTALARWAAASDEAGVRMGAPAPLTLIAVVRGGCAVAPDCRDAVIVGAGEAVLLSGAGPYTVAPVAGTVPDLVVSGPDRYTDASGRPVSGPAVTGTRTCGYPSDAGTSLIVTGSYAWAADVGERLLAALPPVTLLRQEELPAELLSLLAQETAVDAPGQQAVLDRLLDLVLVRAVRAVFARPGTVSPPWWLARADPVVGPALRALHERPAEPWTVPRLAGVVGVSRATLSRRFADRLGTSPMAYLADWRMTLAADLLADPHTTVAAVARAVGYRDESSFATAFKRLRGHSPASRP
ncbi:AraC family transcriptional regulator [Streptomyces arenae]|uniref:AraC family transcriptional regulator n=1 Tax=Streptomyces arenae TaxID=29301 RepID=UPI002658D306|nr:AraC family transcriptional regulator [Streptomyces arenae]